MPKVGKCGAEVQPGQRMYRGYLQLYPGLSNPEYVIVVGELKFNFDAFLPPGCV